MVKTSLHISIPVPCHEDWSKMTPTQCGAFCNACQKEVVDFSQMSEAEIVERLSKANGNVCGRIAANKLNRDLVKYEADHAWYSWKKWVIAAGVLLGVNNAKAEIITAEDTTAKFTMKSTLLWPDAGEKNVSDSVSRKPFVADTIAPTNSSDSTADFTVNTDEPAEEMIILGLMVEPHRTPKQKIAFAFRRFGWMIDNAFRKPKYR